MLQVAYIREQRDKVIAGLQKRGLGNVEELIDHAIVLDKNRKETQ